MEQEGINSFVSWSLWAIPIALAMKSAIYSAKFSGQKENHGIQQSVQQAEYKFKAIIRLASVRMPKIQAIENRDLTATKSSFWLCDGICDS